MSPASSSEIVILILVLIASAVGFLLPMRRVLRNVMGSRDEPGYSLHPLGPRLRRVFSEVLCQSKVIRERPLPGIAHALVYWGFLAFGFASVNHILLRFGVELLPRESVFGEIYFEAVAVFALLVAVGITGLALRRFLAQPKWLGKVSYESGFVAFLILLLVLTYLADYFEAGPPTINWWLHTLALAIFLPLIPHTKHLHLLLSHATVFFARSGFSTVPPLEGDEDFGLDTGKDLTRLNALEAYTCVECGRCTEHCPAANTGKELNPKEIILGIRSYLNANGPGAEAPLLGQHLSQEAAFQCTTCGACEYQCPVGIQHLSSIIGLRRGAVNTGKWEDDAGSKLFVNLERHGNPLGIAPRERTNFIKKAGLPFFDGSQEYCLWMGCMGAYDPHGREIIIALTQLLDYLGVTYGVLKKEKCTGDSARRLGNDLAFEELASTNLETMESKGVKKLLSICPHCVRTISTDWNQIGEAPPVEHYSEFLARHADRLPQSANGSVVYHDPCYLGRYSDVYEAPRQVVSHYGELTEPEKTRERSFCCGAGGGLVFLGEEKGKRVSVERAEQLAATGADKLAVACPFCHTMFRDALPGMEQAPELVDIAQLAAAALPSPPAEQ